MNPFETATKTYVQYGRYMQDYLYQHRFLNLYWIRNLGYARQVSLYQCCESGKFLIVRIPRFNLIWTQIQIGFRILLFNFKSSVIAYWYVNSLCPGIVFRTVRSHIFKTFQEEIGSNSGPFPRGLLRTRIRQNDMNPDPQLKYIQNKIITIIFL